MVNGPVTHFAPIPRKAPRMVARGVPTVVSVAALAGVSAMVREAFGDRVLERANRAAMLDIEAIEDENCFIPHATMTSFLAEIGRQAGEADLGLLMAPQLSLARYGDWGAYVLGAETLGEAIRRAIATLGYHSQGDRMEMVATESGVRVGYRNAGRGHPGYVHVASGTLGVLLSLFRWYLPADWRPRLVQLDVPRPASATGFEDVFGCPVTFGAPAISMHRPRCSTDGRRGDRRRVWSRWASLPVPGWSPTACGGSGAWSSPRSGRRSFRGRFRSRPRRGPSAWARAACSARCIRTGRTFASW